MLVLLLAIFTVPLLGWGWERWSWDSAGLKRRNWFGERKLDWGSITDITVRGRGFRLNTANNASVPVDEFVAGMPLIFAAAAHYRPDLAGAVNR